MDRRTFLAALGVLAARPPDVSAQTVGRVYRLGMLVESKGAARRLELVLPELVQKGYREGANLTVERRNCEGHMTRLEGYAAELVALKPDVLLCSGARVVKALHDATRTIPIVMAAASDPVGIGLVDSLSHPGGNVTGLDDARLEVAGKRLQLLKEAFPHVQRVAVWAQPDIPDTKVELAALERSAAQLGLQTRAFTMTNSVELERAARDSRQWGAQAVYVANGPVVTVHRRQAADLVAAMRVPGVYPTLDHVEVGGLMAYAVSNAEIAARAATYIDRILSGAKPADLPIEQPTKIELAINAATAHALGLSIPQSLYLRADKVVE